MYVPTIYNTHFRHWRQKGCCCGWFRRCCRRRRRRRLRVPMPVTVCSKMMDQSGQVRSNQSSFSQFWFRPQNCTDQWQCVFACRVLPNLFVQSSFNNSAGGG